LRKTCPNTEGHNMPEKDTWKSLGDLAKELARKAEQGKK
jgi:hypothetical protein